MIITGRRRLLCWLLGCRWRHFDNCCKCQRCGRVLIYIDLPKEPN